MKKLKVRWLGQNPSVEELHKFMRAKGASITGATPTFDGDLLTFTCVPSSLPRVRALIERLAFDGLAKYEDA